eukprot:1585477-Amphidinium_carterae.1
MTDVASESRGFTRPASDDATYSDSKRLRSDVFSIFGLDEKEIPSPTEDGITEEFFRDWYSGYAVPDADDGQTLPHEEVAKGAMKELWS